MIEISGVETRYVKYSVQESELLVAVEKMLLNSVGLWYGDWLSPSNHVLRDNEDRMVDRLVRSATEQDINIFKLISEIKKAYYTKPRSEHA